jgi:hypothetical protein
MSEPTRGRRDPFSDDWRWGLPRDEPRHPTGPVKRLLFLAILSATALAIALVVFLLTNDEGEGGANGQNTTPAEGSEGPHEPTRAAQDTPSTTPPTIQLFAWSPRDNRWIEGELPAGSGYREGLSAKELDRTSRMTWRSSINALAMASRRSTF